jgi:hypothetical protein
VFGMERWDPLCIGISHAATAAPPPQRTVGLARASRLEVDDFRPAILPENMMAAFDPLLKSGREKQTKKAGESDIAVRRSPEDYVKDLVSARQCRTYPRYAKLSLSSLAYASTSQKAKRPSKKLGRFY